MMRYLFLALALFVVSSVHAEGGLRRLRREFDDFEAKNVDSSVPSHFLDLAQEVQGPALNRVLRYQQETESRVARKLPFSLVSDRQVPPPADDVDRDLSASLSLSLSMSLSDRIDVVEDSETLSLSLSLSLSLPLERRF